MTRDPGSRNLIAVHDLLLESFGTANDAGRSLAWGLALYPRLGRFEAPVFGVLTCGGESTTLTYRLLHTLSERPVYVSGYVPARIQDAMAAGPPRPVPTALLDQPVLHLSLTCMIGSRPEDHDRTQPLESTMFAGDLRAPIVLLTKHRPDGWPM